MGQGDYAAARAFLEESLSLRKQLRDKSLTAEVAGNLGNAAYAQGDCTEARAQFEESLSICFDSRKSGTGR